MGREMLGTPVTRQQFLLWGVSIAHVSPSCGMVMTVSMLLWWTSDRVPLPLAIKPKVVKEALQWSGEPKCNVTSIEPK